MRFLGVVGIWGALRARGQRAGAWAVGRGAWWEGVGEAGTEGSMPLAAGGNEMALALSAVVDKVVAVPLLDEVEEFVPLLWERMVPQQKKKRDKAVRRGVAGSLESATGQLRRPGLSWRRSVRNRAGTRTKSFAAQAPISDGLSLAEGGRRVCRYGDENTLAGDA